jgi:hypothetical protein
VGSLAESDRSLRANAGYRVAQSMSAGLLGLPKFQQHSSIVAKKPRTILTNGLKTGWRVRAACRTSSLARLHFDHPYAVSSCTLRASGALLVRVASLIFLGFTRVTWAASVSLVEAAVAGVDRWSQAFLAQGSHMERVQMHDEQDMHDVIQRHHKIYT